MAGSVEADRRCPAPTLSGERVTLRPIAEGDFPAIESMLAEPEVAEWWGGFDGPRLRRALEGDEQLLWGIETGGELAGMLMVTEEADPQSPDVELDIFLASAHHGRGLGADALRTALRWFFAERGHHRATIIPSVENERAIRSYARLGFKPVGVLRRCDRSPDGRWRDALIMDILVEELR